MEEVKLFDFLNSINQNKKDIMTEDNESVYSPYVINRFLSGSLDTVLYAQEMNQRPFLTSRMQYDYLRHSIRPGKRFCKWLKKEKIDKIELLKKFFNYSTRKAEEISDIVSDEQLISMQESMNTGGIK